MLLRVEVEKTIFRSEVAKRKRRTEITKRRSSSLFRGGVENANIVAAFRGIHVSPAKHSSGSVIDGRTDRQTDGQTDRQTDRRRTKWSLCVAMLRRLHKNDNKKTQFFFLISPRNKKKTSNCVLSTLFRSNEIHRYFETKIP